MLAWSGQHNTLEASSHREAPLIADDPLADNTDLYAFRSPDSPANDGNASVTIIANYIPLELPQGGPNYNTFGENMRYEIHVKNDAANDRRRHHLPLHVHPHQPGPHHVLQHPAGPAKPENHLHLREKRGWRRFHHPRDRTASCRPPTSARAPLTALPA